MSSYVYQTDEEIYKEIIRTKICRIYFIVQVLIPFMLGIQYWYSRDQIKDVQSRIEQLDKKLTTLVEEMNND